MRLALGILLALLLGAAPAAAGEQPAAEWQTCRQKAIAAPGTWGCHCFYSAGKKTGDWRRARQELEKLEHAADDPFWLFTLGRIDDALGGCAASRHLFERSAELFAAAGERQGETYSRSNLLRCLEQQDLPAARREGRKLFALASGTGDPKLVARAALRQAQIAVSAVALDEAEAILIAYPLARLDAFGPAENLGQEWLIQHGRLNLALGRVTAALRDAQERLDRATASGDRLDVARAAYDLAAMSTSLGATPENREATRVAAAAALAAAERSGDLGLLVPPLLLSGRLENDLGQLARCGRLAQEAGDQHGFVACRFAEAAGRAESGASQAAEKLLAEGLAAAGGNADPFLLLQPWPDYLRALFALRPRAEAFAAGTGLLEQVEKVRGAEARPDRRAQLFGVWRELHEWLAGKLLASGDPAERVAAFHILEAGRARELRESLSSGHQLSLAKNQPVRELAAIEKELAADEVLLTFHLDFAQNLFGRPRGGGAVFVSTRGGTRVVRLPDRGRLDPAIALLLGDLEKNRDSPRLARQLGELVFDPLEKALPAGAGKLIVVPAGSLFRLPWAMLRDAGGRQLVDRFEIAMAPAASLPRRGAGVGAGGALVFADPAFAELAASPSSALAAARGASPATRRVDLPRLPLALREGREVHRLLGGAAFEGAEASEERLRDGELGRFSVLHFAAHAVLDDELPERSALLLAPAGADDGRLEPREIAALPLRGQLVTLAGCRSALGRILPGEGPMSLGRAFLAAGAPAVLGSLWELRDDEAATFFSRFYRHLADGERAAAALRATQREIAATGAPAAAWAGVVLLGDGDFRLTPRSAFGRWARFWLAPQRLLPAVAAAALLAAYLAFRRRRRRRLRG